MAFTIKKDMCMHSVKKAHVLCKCKKSTEKNPLQQIYEAAQQFTETPLIQYFDNDFEDWIDIDESYIPKAKDKLMVKDGLSNSQVSRSN